MEAHALAGAEPAAVREVEFPVAHLIILHKGPTWDPSDIEPFCRLISRRFSGEVWAFGSYEADKTFGRVRLRVVSERPFHDLTNRMRFYRKGVRWLEELRARHPPRLAFVSLEPFVSGPLGLYAARRAGGALICEVNGVYASRHNSPSTRMAPLRHARIWMRRAAGRFVLRRATAVRLLFPGQLHGFASLPERIITRQFFETTNLGVFRPGPEEPIVLGVGFPFRVKGFDLLCRAFSQISARHPGWKLVLIGHRIPEEVREGGLEHPGIKAYPGIKHTEIAEWMARCAIFALPSRTEAMGRVLLEAAACGKCRLATRVDGIPTVVEDGVDGVLVGAESLEQLVSALERLMGDEELRRRLGDAARLRAEREFSDDRYLDHYAELVSAALQRSAP